MATITDIIDESITKLDESIHHLPYKPINFREYGFNNICIERVIESANNGNMAKMSFDVKKRVIYQDTEYENMFNDAESYFKVIKNTLKDTGVSFAKKAAILTEFKQDILEEHEAEPAKKIVKEIDYLYEKLLEAKRESGEEEILPISAKNIVKMPAKLAENPMIRIINFIDAVYLNPEQIKKIFEHDFEKESSYRMTILRRIRE